MHRHDHHHGHHHHHGSHGHHHNHHLSHHRGASRRNIFIAMLLNLGFSVVELVGGLYAGSVAVVADAVHDFGDGLALFLAWCMEGIAGKKSDERFSYGYRRVSLLSALFTAIFLVSSSVFVIIQAIPRLFNPVQPKTGWMLAMAVLGITVNALAASRLHAGQTMNERVLSWHLVEDLLGWVVVAISSVVMMFVDLPIIDPILSLVFVGFILFNVLRNLRSTIVLFLQGTPEHMNTDALRAAIMEVPGVAGVHDMHVWSLDGAHHILTMHLVVDAADLPAIEAIKARVKEIVHSAGDHIHPTIEVESAPGSCSIKG
jgi:cobalt-zinc-cadmium efflux system protein